MHGTIENWRGISDATVTLEVYYLFITAIRRADLNSSFSHFSIAITKEILGILKLAIVLFVSPFW